MNLVDLVKNQLSSDVMGKFAEILGTNPQATRDAANAVVPTLLATVGGLTSTRDGAGKLSSTLSGLDENVLGNFARSLTGSQSVVDTGTTLLGSLFGNEALSGLAGVLSRFTGISTKSTSWLLSTLAPLALGVLKRYAPDMSANGLTRLFEGQQENIRNAMPAGLGNLLSNVPDIGAVTEWATGTLSAAGRGGQTALSEAEHAIRSTATSRSSALRWVIPTLAVLGLVVLLFWWGVSRQNIPRQSSPAPSITDQVTGLTAQVSDFFRSATDVLTDMKDAASAQAALPKLKDLTAKLDALRGSIDQLPADAKEKVLTVFKGLSSKLVQLMDKVMATPGVGETIRPIMEELQGKLIALTGV
jgi:hypothetical protein